MAILNSKGSRFAFTLAEVLITLGIIGIIAALTLPTLIQNAKEKATVAKVRETYSILSQAYKHAVAEYGTPEGWYTGTGTLYDPQSHIDMATPMKQYMKLSADCVGKEDTYTKKYCDNTRYTKRLYSSVKLSNGVAVIFRTFAGTCDRKYASNYKNDTCGAIVIDLEPNKTSKNGETSFNFYLTNEGVIPWGKKDSKLTFEKACNKSIEKPYPTFDTGNMYGCTAWVIYQGNMNYLHCDDLSWDGKRTCK